MSTTTVQVQCDTIVSGVVTAASLVPGSANDPTVNAGYYQGATVCGDTNNNGRCDSSETQVQTDVNGHFTLIGGSGAVIADIGTIATNTASGSKNPKRNVFRISAAQLAEQTTGAVISVPSRHRARSPDGGQQLDLRDRGRRTSRSASA